MSRFRSIFRAFAATCLTATVIAPASAQVPTDLLQTGWRTRVAPACPQPDPCCPTTPVPGQPVDPMNPMQVPAPATPTPDFAGLFAGSGADATPFTGLGGYIDNALPATQFRFRYDAAYGNNRPDRAEFFYAKCGCFQTRDSNGPPQPETNVDYQQINAYFEYAYTPRLSFFTDVPVRFINPDVNQNSAGFSDLQFGTKYAILYSPEQVLSLQVKLIVPTGQSDLGLGTGQTWLEPGLLYQRQMSDKWQVFGQFKDQIYLGRQSDFTGNILNYGVGTSYMMARGTWGYMAPVGEVVGWTVLGGKQLDPNLGDAVSADGDTIVNAKFGLRFGFGETQPGQFNPTKSDLYIGFGRALTGEVWYKNMFRLEFRRFF